MATKAEKKKFKLGPIQRAWVRALRSGKYEQTKTILSRLDDDGKTATGHCCLGVLCQVAIKKGVPLRTKPASENPSALAYGGDEYQVLPNKVRLWAAVREESGDFGGENSLADLNDEGRGFSEIADVIEKNAARIFRRSV